MSKVQATAAKSTPVPQQQYTRVGVGVYLISPTGQFLIGHRTSKHGHDTWAAPGGHVEFGEDPVETAIREVEEEVGLRIINPTLIGFTNDTFIDTGKHYVTLSFAHRVPDISLVRNLEPEKWREWRWVYHDELPNNLFLPLENFVNKLGQDGLRHMLATFPR